MQPEQGHHPDYSFIMNPQATRKKGLFGGGDKKQRLLVSAIIGGVLLLALIILFTVVLGGSKGNTERLVGLAKQQTELVRVAGLADTQATTTDTKNFASTVRVTLTSSEHATVALIAKQGQKVTDKQLATSKNTKTDATLNQAKQANQFDEVLSSTLQTSLVAYQKEVSDLYNASKSKSEKALLQDLYNQVKPLITQ
jgi:flagellar basal body-associated protein FliL